MVFYDISGHHPELISRPRNNAVSNWEYWILCRTPHSPFRFCAGAQEREDATPPLKRKRGHIWKAVWLYKKTREGLALHSLFIRPVIINEALPEAHFEAFNRF